jgi:hypothetical protein
MRIFSLLVPVVLMAVFTGLAYIAADDERQRTGNPPSRFKGTNWGVMLEAWNTKKGRHAVIGYWIAAALLVSAIIAWNCDWP